MTAAQSDWEYGLYTLKRGVRTHVCTAQNALEAANVLYQKHTAGGVLPTNAILNAHLQLCILHAEALNIIALYQTLDAQIANITTYNTLLTLAKTQKQILYHYTITEKNNIKPNVYTLNILMSLYEVYEVRKFIFDTMRHEGTAPNIASYNLLLDSALTTQHQIEIITDINQSNIPSSKALLTKIVSSAETLEIAMILHDDIKNNGITLSIAAYISMLQKATCLTDLNDIAVCMTCANVSPNALWDTTFFDLQLKFKNKMQLN
jgi:Pentatricopeptide repeat domain